MAETAAERAATAIEQWVCHQLFDGAGPRLQDKIKTCIQEAESAARAEEREACAKIADSFPNRPALRIAAAIREDPGDG